MDTRETMAKYNITDEMLNEWAKPFEEETFELEHGNVICGCHLNDVGTRRITVIYDAARTRQVEQLAVNKGVKPSEVYREALEYYLQAQA